MRTETGEPAIAVGPGHHLRGVRIEGRSRALLSVNVLDPQDAGAQVVPPEKQRVDLFLVGMRREPVGVEGIGRAKAPILCRGFAKSISTLWRRVGGSCDSEKRRVGRRRVRDQRSAGERNITGR